MDEKRGQRTSLCQQNQLGDVLNPLGNGPLDLDVDILVLNAQRLILLYLVPNGGEDFCVVGGLHADDEWSGIGGRGIGS